MRGHVRNDNRLPHIVPSMVDPEASRRITRRAAVFDVPVDADNIVEAVAPARRIQQSVFNPSVGMCGRAAVHSGIAVGTRKPEQAAGRLLGIRELGTANLAPGRRCQLDPCRQHLVAPLKEIAPGLRQHRAAFAICARRGEGGCQHVDSTLGSQCSRLGSLCALHGCVVFGRVIILFQACFVQTPLQFVDLLLGPAYGLGKVAAGRSKAPPFKVAFGAPEVLVSDEVGAHLHHADAQLSAVFADLENTQIMMLGILKPVRQKERMAERIVGLVESGIVDPDRAAEHGEALLQLTRECP